MSQPSQNHDGHQPATDLSRTALPAFIGVQAGGVRLAVKLQPRSSADGIGAPLGDELKIKVTAPPVDDAANEALLNLLAKTLGCARHRVELVRGRTSRHKTILLHGFEPGEIQAKLTGTPNPS
jgi:uncharacterized protein (TIGR00251 family)